jgi:hypothetical protein
MRCCARPIRRAEGTVASAAFFLAWPAQPLEALCPFQPRRCQPAPWAATAWAKAATSGILARVSLLFLYCFSIVPLLFLYCSSGPGRTFRIYFQRLRPRAPVPRRLGLAVTIQYNHRWTQIDTDDNYPEQRSSMVGIRSPDSDPKPSGARPESGPQNLCSSVSICGSLLHGYGLDDAGLAAVQFRPPAPCWRRPVIITPACRIREPRVQCPTVCQARTFRMKQKSGKCVSD